MVKQSENLKQRVLNTFQVIADNYVQDSLDNIYRTSPLNSVMVKGEMVMFHEVDVNSHIHINYEDLEDKPDEDIEIPNFVQNMLVEQDKLDGEALSKLESPTDLMQFMILKLFISMKLNVILSALKILKCFIML